MHASLELMIGLAIVLTGAKILGKVVMRFGMPAVLGELMMGLILGPSLLGVVHESDMMTGFAQIGVVFLMFMAGLDTDMVEMRRAGRASFLAALGGVLLPLGGGVLLGFLFNQDLATSLFIGAILTATSVSISAETLRQLGRMRSTEGTTILGAAVIDDVMGVIVLAVVMAVTSGQSALLPMLQMVGFFVAIIALGTFLLPRIDAVMQKQSTEMALAAILAIVLVSAWSAEALGGVAAITGAYIAGILLGRTKAIHDHQATITTFTHGFFAPIFFVSIGLQVQLGSLWAAPALIGAMLVIAVVTKLIGSGLGALAAGLRPLQSLRVGVGMISRGEVALIIAGVGFQNKLIGADIFAAAVVMTLVTTLATPILLKLVYSERLAVRSGGIERAQPVFVTAGDEG